MTADCVGGVWTYALELADALAAHGVSVSLATMGPAPDESQRRAAARSAVAALYESTFPLEWASQGWSGVDEAGRWLAELEDDVRPDLVQLNGYVHGTLPWRAPVVMVAHSCVSSWWWAVRGSAPPCEWDEYRRRVRAGLAAADAVVAPSQAMLTEVQRWYGTAGGDVIPNCRQGGWTARPLAKEPFVLSAGRLWDEAKNIEAVCRVAGRLRWPVVVAGDAGDGDALSVPSAVTLLGRVSFERLGGWLRRASVYALPARYEPFGLGPLEAGLAGCALVLGDIPSLREVWGDAALYVDPADEDALAGACRSLIDDPEVLADYGRRARRRALEFTPDRTATAYLAIYHRVLAGLGTPLPVGSSEGDR